MSDDAKANSIRIKADIKEKFLFLMYADDLSNLKEELVQMVQQSVDLHSIRYDSKYHAVYFRGEYYFNKPMPEELQLFITTNKDFLQTTIHPDIKKKFITQINLVNEYQTDYKKAKRYMDIVMHCSASSGDIKALLPSSTHPYIAWTAILDRYTDTAAVTLSDKIINEHKKTYEYQRNLFKERILIKLLEK